MSAERPKQESESNLSYYEILGVSPDATQKIIGRAFKKLQHKHHPDHGGELETSQKLSEAYNTLKNPESRRAYDRKLTPRIQQESTRPEPPYQPRPRSPGAESPPRSDQNYTRESQANSSSRDFRAEDDREKENAYAQAESARRQAEQSEREARAREARRQQDEIERQNKLSRLRKAIITGAALGASIVGGVLYEKNSSSKSVLEPTKIESVLEKGNLLEFETSSGKIVTKNFMEHPKEKSLDGMSFTLEQNESHTIAYYAPDKSFNIFISTAPFDTERARAEKAFLDLLNISQQDACRLNVTVGTSVHVDPERAGKNFGLSFCLAE